MLHQACQSNAAVYYAKFCQAKARCDDRRAVANFQNPELQSGQSTLIFGSYTNFL